MITRDVPKKLFLLDAFALIYRAYFAFSKSPRINSDGFNTSAIFGFTNTLLEILNKEKPTHIAVVFDTATPTQRHTEFADYKANREEMPEDLSSSLPFIFQLLEGFRIQVITCEGYEADDIIGTLALEAEKRGFTTYMMTPDKDYGQLVDANTFIYKPARGGNDAEILDTVAVCNKWQIENVKQLIDILGLMGDAVDNIPGIPGVGEKTAIQMIKEFGSVEQLLLNTEKLKGKLREKVEANKEMAILSKKLATIITDVPVDFDESALELKEIDKDALKEMFRILEFKRIAEQVLGVSPPTHQSGNDAKKSKPPASESNNADLFSEFPEDGRPAEGTGESNSILKNIATYPHTYHLVESEAELEDLIKKLEAEKYFCFDSETTSLDDLTAELVGFSFAFQAQEAYYVPLPADYSECNRKVKRFQRLFENEEKILVGQNIKYDYSVLLNYGVEIKNKLFDTMVAHFLLHPEMRHNMNFLSETYLHYQPVSIESLIGKKGKEIRTMREVEVDKIKEYAAEDADVTWQLKDKFQPQLKSESLVKLFEEVEMPLISVLVEMEREGVKINGTFLKDYSTELTVEILELDTEIQALAGIPFSVSSPKQVGEVLFNHLKIVEKPGKTKTGQFSTGEEVLSKLKGKHPIVSKILEYREALKLKNTYLDSLAEMAHPITGRVHSSFNQVVAVTGRLSSDHPNLQNIPVRTERGRRIRKAFVPRDEKHTLLSADYSQIELRIVASISGDPGMCEAFRLGKDIHLATAAKVFGVTEEEVTKEMRYKAKSVNFGLIYGQGAFGLSENIGTSRTEAKELIDNYFREYALIRKYMDNQVSFAREKGYVQTLMGRKRWLRDINSANAMVRGFAERNAVNAPIQGSAADMIKLAMIRISHDLKRKNMKSKMILQVHDELVFDVLKQELEEVKGIVERGMKEALPLDIPLEVGMGDGPDWLSAH